MIRALLTILMLSALPAQAQTAPETLPALYRVSGVPADDVLNLRDAPDAGAAQQGSLPPDATGVEVVALSQDGKWARVNLGEGAGWVARRFLTREAGPDWLSLDRPMTCFGTEPFWSLAYDPARRNMTLAQMGDENGPLGLWIDWHLTSASRPGQIGWKIDGPARSGFATLTAEACGDGMSDRAYGISVSFFLNPAQESGAAPLALAGCCSLAN